MKRSSALTIAMFAAAVSLASLPGRADDRFLPELRIGNENTHIQVYGQFDPALLFVDDGRYTDAYFVDDNNASPRFGIQFETTFENGVTFGANYKAQYDPFSSAIVSQENGGAPDWDRYLTRNAEIHAFGPAGRFWAGQGSMASDYTAEVDLSGTSVAGYSSVGDLAGGQLFRFRGGDLSDHNVGEAFRNYDGLSRKLRFRYDTPELAGFTLSASWGKQVIPKEEGPNVWDAALRYTGEFGALRIAGAAAYGNKGDGLDRYDGSVSALYVPSGISLTVAAAYDEDSSSQNGSYVYGKLGYQRDFFAAGTTAFSVDAYGGNDILLPGTGSTSWGLQAVQDLDYYNAQVYAGYRVYKLTEETAEYDTIRAGMTGILVKF